MAKKTKKLYEVCGYYDIIIKSKQVIPQSVTRFYWAKSDDDALNLFQDYLDTFGEEIDDTDLVEVVFDWSEVVQCHS